MRRVSYIALSFVLIVAASFVSLVGMNGGTQAAAAEARAFPGAEGFGTQTTHGRGGQVIKVTNLNDSGTGSLRAAVEASGPRIVVFTVGGTIQLEERLEITDPHIYIAGQTAPGGGVALRMKPNNAYDKGSLKIDTHDVLIRYMRFRPGNGGDADDSHDAVSAYQEGGGVYNVVLDHNSISWGIDENVNIYYDVDNYTISNSIISEAFSDAGHPDGEHSKGMLIGGGSTNGSVHHNLFASNVDRNPQVSGVAVADIRNNVVYNYGDGSGDGVTLVSSSKGEPKVNWVNNYYKPGPDSPTGRAEFATYEGDTGNTHQWFGAGNKRWTPNGVVNARVGENFGRVSNPLPAAPVTTSTAAKAYEDVLADAGASNNRDTVDARIVNEVRNGTGSMKDGNSDVTWPALASGTAPADADNDGMPNAWESANGTNPNAKDAAGDVDSDGYTNIEDYVNGLVGEDGGGTIPTDEPTTPEPTPNEAPEVNVGADKSTEVDVRVLVSGTATDDGLPDPPGDLFTPTEGSSIAWSVVSGNQENVDIQDWNDATTHMTFSAPGDYTMRLTADDSELVSFDEVAVTVTAPTPTPKPEPVATELVCPVVESPAPGDTVTCTYE